MWQCFCRRERWYPTARFVVRKNLFGFRGRSTGTCAKSIVHNKINRMCLCVVTLQPAVAIGKDTNMPRECRILRCSATPWVLKIKTQLACGHPTVPPNTVAFTQ